MKIIGIDPGSNRIGYAILEKKNLSKFNLITYGTIQINSNTPLNESLILLRSELINLINNYKPDKSSVEELFFNKNVKTASRVFQSRGVIILTLAEYKIPILEPTASQIKKGTTSYGKANKNQIRESLKILLKIESLDGLDDSWDAIAAAFVGFSMIGSKYIN
jgi:crossover junction endodeoxyribonuclease RuvC